MKMNTQPIFALSLVIAAGLTCSCNKQRDEAADSQAVEDARTRLEVKLDEAKAALKDKKQELTAAAQRRLDVLDGKIDELKRGAEESGEEASRKAVKELEEKRDAVAQALDAAKNASAEQWDELTSSARDALDEAEDAYNRALDKLKTK